MMSRLMLSCLLLAGLCGCAADHTDLCFTANDGMHLLRQRFDQCYCREMPNGDKEAVLLDDGIVGGQDDGRHGLHAAQRLLPRQLVHIQMFWKPTIFRPDHPAAANASLHWYVMGINPADGWIDYSGTALISFDGGGDTRHIQIHTAWITGADKHGQLIDPIGLGTITGNITAVVDSTRVDIMLGDLSKATSAAPIARTSTTRSSH